MIKLYITAIESKENGTAVTLFEDYLVGYTSTEEIELDSQILMPRIARKIKEVEAINNQAAIPF